MKNKLLIVYLVLCIAEIVTEYSELQLLRYIVKPTLMIVLAFYFYQESKPDISSFAKKILAALVFSWGGDVFLMFPGFFLPGLISFLIAHVFYILAFFENINSAKEKRPLSNTLLFILPFLVSTGGLFRILFPSLGEMMVPVAVYTSVITVMGISAALRFGSVSKQSFVSVLSGAVIFMLSDSTIALNKFLYNGELPYARVVIMVTYLLAQYLIVKGCLEFIHSQRKQ
ncbi:MAG: lysoplasmalogenase [Bacteroidia bacterium]